MKITLSSAMRARDVSRPRPGQLADAAAREGQRAEAGEQARAPRRDAAPAPAPGSGEGQFRGRRRRRRPREA